MAKQMIEMNKHGYCLIDFLLKEILFV
jgi:hypothetical protein